jgi:hypothetical protein
MTEELKFKSRQKHKTFIFTIHYISPLELIQPMQWVPRELSKQMN